MGVPEVRSPAILFSSIVRGPSWTSPDDFLGAADTYESVPLPAPVREVFVRLRPLRGPELIAAAVGLA